jgi:hypothetical protein
MLKFAAHIGHQRGPLLRLDLLAPGAGVKFGNRLDLGGNGLACAGDFQEVY